MVTCRGFGQQWQEDGTYQWSVYVAVAEAGLVLYVGMTSRGLGRVFEHSMRSWWPITRELRMFHVETEEEARELEADCIRTYLPMFNVNSRPAGAPEVIRSAGLLERELQMVRDELAELRTKLEDAEANLESQRLDSRNRSEAPTA